MPWTRYALSQGSYLLKLRVSLKVSSATLHLHCASAQATFVLCSDPAGSLRSSPAAAPLMGLLQVMILLTCLELCFMAMLEVEPLFIKMVITCSYLSHSVRIFQNFAIRALPDARHAGSLQVSCRHCSPLMCHTADCKSSCHHSCSLWVSLAAFEDSSLCCLATVWPWTNNLPHQLCQLCFWFYFFNFRASCLMRHHHATATPE